MGKNNDSQVESRTAESLSENLRIEWESIAPDPEWIGTGISLEFMERKGVTAVVLKYFNWRAITEFYQWCNYNLSIFL